jgi:cytochrome oxidase Cu insertion factor (SCO1/SenC/PrrC family)
MADIAAGLEEVGPPIADRVEVAFVTVDIERDTGSRMTDYLKHFFPNQTIRALRAVDSFQLYEVTKQFGAQWQVDSHEPGATNYGVAHSGLTYVVDDKGQLVWEWPFGTTGPEVAATLNQLMETVYPAS